jgi:hypothetical protein
MPPRKRFIIALIIVVLAAAFCGSRVYSQDRAKPRGQGGSQAQPDRQRGGRQPEARQPRAGRSDEGSRSQDRARRDDSEARRPRPGSEARRDDRRPPRSVPGPSYDTRRRHPRPDGYYERRYPQWDNYHWRNWNHRDRWHRGRFPRLFFGLRLFDGYSYMGRTFGPHYGLWHFHDGAWRMFYWPFAYPPMRGCGWYLVPTDRVEFYDPWSGEYYWDYTGWDYVYICFD